jgi:hypothetical protein
MTEMLPTIALAVLTFLMGWYMGKIHMIAQEIRDIRKDIEKPRKG